MNQVVSFGKPDVAGEGTNSDVDTTEEDVLIITNQGYFNDSQFSIYLTVTLGTHTSMSIRYYCRDEVDGAWHLIPFKNEATGILTDVASVVNAANTLTPVDNIALPACFGFRVTAQGTGGANGTVTAKVLSRSN